MISLACNAPAFSISFKTSINSIVDVPAAFKAATTSSKVDSPPGKRFILIVRLFAPVPLSDTAKVEIRTHSPITTAPVFSLTTTVATVSGSTVNSPNIETKPTNFFL